MSKCKASDTGIPMKDIINPVNAMYIKEQPQFGIPMKALNKNKNKKVRGNK